MSQWFFSKQGKTYGPVTFDQLRQFTAQGKLLPEDLIWVEQSKQWLPARSVPGLLAPVPSVQQKPGPARPPSNPAIPGQSRPASAPTLTAPAAQGIPRSAPLGTAATPPLQPAAPPIPAKKSSASFSQQLRTLPKPVLFGLFGAVGGLLGAMLFAEMLFALLSPSQQAAEKQPPFQMAVSSQLTVYLGDKNNFKVKILRDKDFKGPVELEALETPEGIIIPAIKLEEGEEEKDVDVQAARTAKPGTYMLMVAGKGGPAEDPHRANEKLELTIEAPPPFQMAISSRLTVYPGNKNQFKVKVARDEDFKGPVELEVLDTPEGIRIPAIKLKEGEEEKDVDVQAARTVKPGTYKLKVAGKGGPAEDQHNTLGEIELTIEAPPPLLKLSITPQIKVYQGTKTRFFIKIARFYFNESVNLTFSDFPKGIRGPTTLHIPPAKDGGEVADIEVDLQASEDAELTTRDITINASARLGGVKELIDDATFKLEVREVRIPKADIIFVLDLTGSMGFAINGVKDGIRSFVEKLKAEKVDARIALLGFRDIGADAPKEQFELLEFDGRTFTTDYVNFSKKVSMLAAKGGGDTPESSMQALVKAGEQPFRDDAAKVVVLITDAPPKVHPGVPPASMPETVRELEKLKVDQVHLISKQADYSKYYKPLLDKFDGTFADIDKSLNAASFAALLPKLSESISKITIEKTPDALDQKPQPPPAPLETSPRPPTPPASEVYLTRPPAAEVPKMQALQSTQAYAQEDSLQLLVAIGVWTAAVALGICLMLIFGQRFYLRQAWMNIPDLAKGFLGGLLAGSLGGMVGQGFFQLTAGETTGDLMAIISRLLGWGLLGALIGSSMALIVPNLKWQRGLLGGILGGIVGALGFMAVSDQLGNLFGGVLGSVLGRLIGATLLGLCIGLMVALAELAFRRYWLEVTFSAREVRTVTLGTAAVGIGGDERLASVFVQGAPALALRYRLQGDRVLCEDMATGRTTEAPPGQRRQVGNVTITVCSPAVARSSGYTLLLSSGKKLPLGEGMPLTADDLPGLQSQGTDGTVALISPRPNDPKTLLLRNRSKQVWTIREPSGKQDNVEPGRAVELALNLLVNFGQVQAKVIPEDKSSPAKQR